MFNSFDDLLKNQSNSFKKLQEKIQQGSKKNWDDPTFYKITFSQEGTATVVMRFLPAPRGEDMPYVQYYSYKFKGPGGWYNELSPSTFGDRDPVGEANSKLWNSGFDEDKEIARSRSRKNNYVANVYIVSDKNAPENEGKVFKFRFGVKIWDKIKSIMAPEYDDKEPIDIFNLLEGANFRLRAKMTKNGPNYDDSEWDMQAPLLKGDVEKLKAVWESCYSLQEIVDRSKFKSYEALKARFLQVTGESEAAAMKDAFSSDGPAKQPQKAEEDAFATKREEPARQPAKAAALEDDFSLDDFKLD